MVKNPLCPAASTASFSSRSATRTARIGPSGGVASPNRLMSALLNGRSQANALPATDQVRLPHRSPSVTSASDEMISMASSTVATVGPATAGSAAAHHLGRPLLHLVGGDVLDVGGDVPAMAERIFELTGPVAVELVLHSRDLLAAGLDGPGEHVVDVFHVDHHRHGRATQSLRRRGAHVGERVGEHDHGAAELELGM